jgi:hypothetical protein
VLSAADLLAGEGAARDVEVPETLLGGTAGADTADRRVRLKALTVGDLRLIARAARDADELTAVLMVQRSLVEPALTIPEVSRMPVGLLQFLLREVNDLSGITASEEEIARAIEDPLAQAAFRLSQAFGWTPEEIGRLTMGEVRTHLELLKSA